MKLVGPTWLEASVDGSALTWSSEINFSSIPGPLQAYFPDDQLTFEASGDSTSFEFKLAGDPSMMVDGHIKSEIPFLQSFTTRELHASSALNIRSWSDLVQSSNDEIEAELSVHGNAVDFEIAQGQATIPWSINGHWVGDELQFHALIDQFPISAQRSLPVEAIGTLNNRRSWKDIHCIATIDMDDHAIECEGEINGLSLHPEWALSLNGAGLQTDISGQGSPQLWVHAMSSFIARKPTTWPTFNAQGSVNESSPILSWMDVPLDLFERGSFEIGSSASDLSAQFLLPKWRMGEIIMDSTHVTLETIDQPFLEP